MTVDRLRDEGDSHLAAADTPMERGADVADPREPPADQASPAARAARTADYRAAVDATYRARAIDQGYEQVREIERRTVNPAMRHIEAEDPTRHLAGLENSVKGKGRLTEKVIEAMDERGRTVEEAFEMVKDAIRYTFCYSEDHYTEGVYADCERLENGGFERFDRKNSWAHEEYKGINSRWRVPEGGQLFEVQFHTQASFDAKEETHAAYERLRSLPEDEDEVRQLHTYQREVTSKVPIPPGALDIPDYTEESR